MTTDAVVLTVPAEASHCALIRTAAAAVTARADFTIAAIDDLKLAVDEACALLLARAAPEGRLRAAFTSRGPQVAVDLSVPTLTARIPGTDSIHWLLISALVDTVESELEAGILHLRLTAHGIGAPAL